MSFLSKVGRYGAAIGSGGMSEVFNSHNITSVGRTLGLTPGPLPQDPYQSPDPYGPGVQWDSSGMPVGRMPRGQYALDYQYEANRRASQRQQVLWSDAQNVLRQGSDLLQSYRPGGSAALASGIYGQRASLYGTQAMNTEAPDLLMGYRDHQQALADRSAQQAARFARTMGIVNAVSSIAGAVAGGGRGGSLALNAGDTIEGGNAPLGAQNAQGQTMLGPGWGNPSAGQQAPPGSILAMPPMQGQQAQGGAYQSQVQGDQPSYQGGAGAGPQGAGGPSGRGAGPQGGGGDNAQFVRGGGEGDIGMGGGHGGPMPPVSFTPQEMAANAVAASPVASSTIYMDAGESDYLHSSVALLARGARLRLQEAMA